MLGAPACLASMIAQAACLGSQDSVTPLFVVLACGAFNAVGDVFLVNTLGMGIRGAAIATALSEFISMALLMRAVGEFSQPATISRDPC
jgi:multidrug resistance protein, MATE family